ncbi:hypothetical protein HYS91_00650 [Candidatus Daviesbacteria bacterium]|nr:hypothetical protein [Candidatus Daviesbacteria bacterium]
MANETQHEGESIQPPVFTEVMSSIGEKISAGITDQNAASLLKDVLNLDQTFLPNGNKATTNEKVLARIREPLSGNPSVLKELGKRGSTAISLDQLRQVVRLAEILDIKNLDEYPGLLAAIKRDIAREESAQTSPSQAHKAAIPITPAEPVVTSASELKLEEYLLQELFREAAQQITENGRAEIPASTKMLGWLVDGALTRALEERSIQLREHYVDAFILDPKTPGLIRFQTNIEMQKPNKIINLDFDAVISGANLSAIYFVSDKVRQGVLSRIAKPFFKDRFTEEQEIKEMLRTRKEARASGETPPLHKIVEYYLAYQFQNLGVKFAGLQLRWEGRQLKLIFQGSDLSSTIDVPADRGSTRLGIPEDGSRVVLADATSPEAISSPAEEVEVIPENVRKIIEDLRSAYKAYNDAYSTQPGTQTEEALADVRTKERELSEALGLTGAESYKEVELLKKLELEAKYNDLALTDTNRTSTYPNPHLILELFSGAPNYLRQAAADYFQHAKLATPAEHSAQLEEDLMKIEKLTKQAAVDMAKRAGRVIGDILSWRMSVGPSFDYDQALRRSDTIPEQIIALFKAKNKAEYNKLKPAVDLQQAVNEFIDSLANRALLRLESTNFHYRDLIDPFESHQGHVIKLFGWIRDSYGDLKTYPPESDNYNNIKKGIRADEEQILNILGVTMHPEYRQLLYAHIGVLQKISEDTPQEKSNKELNDKYTKALENYKKLLLSDSPNFKNVARALKVASMARMRMENEMMERALAAPTLRDEYNSADGARRAVLEDELSTLLGLSPEDNGRRIHELYMQYKSTIFKTFDLSAEIPIPPDDFTGRLFKKDTGTTDAFFRYQYISKNILALQAQGIEVSDEELAEYQRVLEELINLFYFEADVSGRPIYYKQGGEWAGQDLVAAIEGGESEEMIKTLYIRRNQSMIRFYQELLDQSTSTKINEYLKNLAHDAGLEFRTSSIPGQPAKLVELPPLPQPIVVPPQAPAIEPAPAERRLDIDIVNVISQLGKLYKGKSAKTLEEREQLEDQIAKSFGFDADRGYRSLVETLKYLTDLISSRGLKLPKANEDLGIMFVTNRDEYLSLLEQVIQKLEKNEDIKQDIPLLVGALRDRNYAFLAREIDRYERALPPEERERLITAGILPTPAAVLSESGFVLGNAHLGEPQSGE